MRGRVVAWVLVAGGCSSSLQPDRDGGSIRPGQDGGAGAATLYAPCAEGTQIGSFGLSVMATPMDSKAGNHSFDGTVYDRPFPQDYTRPVASEGDCTLMEPDPWIACTPACTGLDACYPDGTCAPNRVSQNVGTVRLTGSAGTVSFEASVGDYMTYGSSGPGQIPYPFSLPGAAITLQTTGGSYAPFTLAGRGLTPLSGPSGALPIARDQALAFQWNTPDPSERSRVIAYIYLGGDGLLDGAGIPGSGDIVCDFPDTGSGTVPAALLTRLIDQGVGTVPLMTLRRTTVSSVQIAAGCVSFTVVSYDNRSLVLN